MEFSWVRVLLRKIDGKVYYSGYGRWAPTSSRALAFETIEEALLFNRQEHLQGTEIVLEHSDLHHWRVLPIGVTKWQDRQSSFPA